MYLARLAGQSGRIVRRCLNVGVRSQCMHLIQFAQGHLPMMLAVLGELRAPSGKGVEFEPEANLVGTP
jgi:hypothetical protein